MSALFQIKVSLRFCAAHVIHGHQGPCARLHGHNWTVEAEAEGRELNDIGMAVDFHDIKTHLRPLVAYVDHQFLNELEPFKATNPTAEVIARWFYRELAPKLEADGVRLIAINIHETDTCSVRYSEPEGV